jgi:hypothetical protein
MRPIAGRMRRHEAGAARLPETHDRRPSFDIALSYGDAVKIALNADLFR